MGIVGKLVPSCTSAAVGTDMRPDKSTTKSSKYSYLLGAGHVETEVTRHKEALQLLTATVISFCRSTVQCFEGRNSLYVKKIQDSQWILQFLKQKISPPTR